MLSGNDITKFLELGSMSDDGAFTTSGGALPLKGVALNNHVLIAGAANCFIKGKLFVQPGFVLGAIGFDGSAGFVGGGKPNVGIVLELFSNFFGKFNAFFQFVAGRD